jgi:TRAP transporter TAXI family solute receptor
VTKSLACPTLVAFVAISCASQPEPPTPSALTIATGGQGGAFYPLGEELSRLYSSRIPGVTMTVETGASGANVEAIEQGEVELALAQADVAYTAFRRGTDALSHPFAEVRGMAVLWRNTVQLVVPRDSAIKTPGELGGRRVAVGSRGSGSETLARIVLDSYGFGERDLTRLYHNFQDTIAGLRTGEIDAALISAGVPTAAVLELSGRPGFRLVPIRHDHVRGLRGQFPFLQPLIVPKGTYPGVDSDVETVGVSILLTCRVSLEEDLVYQMTKLLFEALPELGDRLPVARLINPEQAPTTPIPLHPGAARYYREREILQ